MKEIYDIGYKNLLKIFGIEELFLIPKYFSSFPSIKI